MLGHECRNLRGEAEVADVTLVVVRRHTLTLTYLECKFDPGLLG